MNEENKSAIERAREYGIDISLLESSLNLTVEQRLRRLQDWLEFSKKIDFARRKLYPQLDQSDYDAVRRLVEDSPT